jgi:CubicO group peptidase (beta-lactamase class C family)
MEISMISLRITTHRIILIVLLAAGGAVSIFGQQPAGAAATALAPTALTAAAEQRAKILVETLSSGEPAAWRKFIGENFTKSSLERVSPERRFVTFARIYDRTRGLALKNVRQTKPNEVTATVVSQLLGETSELLVLVEENAPYQITAIGFGPVRATGGAGAGPAAAKKLSDQQIAGELDGFLKKLTGADNFSGAVLLAKDNKVFFEKAYGQAHKDFRAPNDVRTKFNLGSMNKMFTAVSIAQLVEAGKLSFEDPLGKFLPDFPDKAAAEKIKIKHLLTHTSGLGSYFNERFFNASRANYRTVDDYLELAKGDKSAFEPGTKWQYSNTGFLLLGKIIEKVSGRNYFDYVRENIYKKAGMTETDSYELDRVNANLAVGYEKEYTDKGIVFRNNIFEHVISGGPAGGGYSTVEDLMKFAAALQAGKLVGSETVKILLSPKPEIGSPEYGYGFFVESEGGRTLAGHGGGFNGVSSDLTMFLGSNYTAVVLSNYGNASQPVVAKIRELVR